MRILSNPWVLYFRIVDKMLLRQDMRRARFHSHHLFSVITCPPCPSACDLRTISCKDTLSDSIIYVFSIHPNIVMKFHIIHIHSHVLEVHTIHHIIIYNHRQHIHQLHNRWGYDLLYISRCNISLIWYISWDQMTLPMCLNDISLSTIIQISHQIISFRLWFALHGRGQFAVVPGHSALGIGLRHPQATRLASVPPGGCAAGRRTLFGWNMGAYPGG